MRRLKVLFKTKGGHKEGMGDVTSSLAIAEGFKNQGHNVSFLINDNNSTIALISQKGFAYQIINSLTELARFINGQFFDLSVLNQLNTPQNEALIFRKNSKMLVTIDDNGDATKLADLRFNVLYPIEDSYSDFKYIALSALFPRRHAIPKAIKENVETILVTQGGSDTYGYTPKIIKALYDIPNEINIKVVIGPNFSHHQQLDEALQNATRNFNIVKGENNLLDLMLQADLAISAGGNTLFELACLGVPVIVVCGEPFEVDTANRLQKEGFCINLGFGEHVDENDISIAVAHLIRDINLRSNMSKKGKDLIDGFGVKRIVDKVHIFYGKYNS